MQIAVDGPAGSGKSTISKMIASKYGLIYLDTGAMYRSVAFLALKHNLTVEDAADLSEHVSFNFYDNGKKLKLVYDYNGVHNVDVTDKIRTPEVTALVSEVSAIPKVRAVMVKKQQEIAAGNDVIMDGRDIGTVVLPNADAKFFLTATAEERARRRMIEWGKNNSSEYDKILSDIIKRDHMDSTRSISPLKKASDAEEIDTTDLTIDEVIEIIGGAVDKLRRSQRL